MSYDELKEIFVLCDSKTLDSLDILLENVDDYDLTVLNNAYSFAYRKIWEKNRNEFEGMNEYDYLTKVQEFDMTKIMDYIDVYNQKELNCFKDLIVNAIEKLKGKEYAKSKMLPNLEEILTRINKCLSELPALDHDLNEDELKTLFNKYSALELKAFDTVFDYIYSYDISHIVKAKNEVQKSKEKECFEKKGIRFLKEDVDVLVLTDKNPDLDKKELFFLEELLDEADYNVSIQRYRGNNTVPFSEISNYHENILEELDRRKVKIKKLGD